MRGFVERTDLEHGLDKLRSIIRPLVDREQVPLGDSLDRVLASDLVADRNVPGFNKSAVDGYALRGEDTFGATAAAPLSLELVGELLPGSGPQLVVAPGRTARIMTGAPVPEGADAVLMAEYASERDGSVLVSAPVTPGRNVAREGEDIRNGTTVLHRGRLLQPQDLGVMASLGRVQVPVVRRPKVALASTGNELIGPGQAGSTGGGQVVDSNSIVLEALLRRHGAVAHGLGIVRDDPEALTEVLLGFQGDLLITTGATSVGREDYLPGLLAEHGELLVHGVNIRPGSPVGFGRLGQRPVMLLPGNPVAVMVCFDMLVRPMLMRMLGLPEARRDRTRKLPLRRKLASELNRIDHVRVRVVEDGVEPLRSGGAGVLSAMSRADGFVVIEKDLEGIEAGELVEVHLF
jgi:molybdopterin molybdotransferase